MRINIIRNFILLSLIILTSMPVFTKELKFIQVTDSHVSTLGNEYSQRDVGNSKNIFEKTIQDINSVRGIDFVVFTGDNIDQANSTELKNFINMANKLNVPYYMVIGNHEVFKSQDLDKKKYIKIVRKYSKNCRPEGANYVFKNKGIVFIVVDGAKEVIPGPAGYYKKDTLKWFDRQLTKYEKSNVIIFQHFPIVEPYYNRTHTTYNKDDYEAILKKHNNVIAIFSGHFHANGEKMVDEIYHVSTPSLVEAPHNYKVVEINIIKGQKPKIYTQLRHAE